MIARGAKRARRPIRAVRSGGQWGWRNQLESREISGKRLLIVGYGRSGRHLARMASGFAMEIVAFDPFISRRLGGRQTEYNLSLTSAPRSAGQTYFGARAQE